MGDSGLILIDTNIFLEILLGRGRAKACKDLMDKVSAGKIEGIVTHFSIHAIEAIMGQRGGELASFLRTLDQTAGLYVYDTSISDEVSASLLTKSTGMDFDDALQYFVAKKVAADAILSYDKHFDGSDLKRVEPKSLL